MENCTMKHTEKELSHGTKAEVVICMKINDFNSLDQKEAWDFFKECADSFHICRVPCIVGENKGSNTVINNVTT